MNFLWRSTWLCVALYMIIFPGSVCQAQTNPRAVLQELGSFEQMGSVLYVAAHPDDENTQLIAYLARGRNYRTAYLSLTRGDGGQNVLGSELGPELGVLRTEELLAARRVDGGRHFFSRALDFGFSKDYRQTMKVWDRQEVLSDIVRVIRTFRPDVIVTRFSTIPGNTHGHHTASAILAQEAFKLSGDPKAFPEQLTDLTPWQAKRIFTNGFGIGLGGSSSHSHVVRMSVSGTDPVTGMSFGELAGLSRSMHKTQGFGNFVGGGRGPARAEAFQLLDGEPATKDIMDGIDTTWNRVDAPDVGNLAVDLIAHFDSQDLSANIPALLAIKAKLASVAADPIVDEKRHLLDHIIQECLGLEVQTTSPQAEVVPGEIIELHHRVILHSTVAVQWMGLRYPELGGDQEARTIALEKDRETTRNLEVPLPPNTPISQPYWLREPGTAGMFRVDDPKLIGRPESPPVLPNEYVFSVGGQTIVAPDEPAAVVSDSSGHRTRRPLDVIPPVSMKFVSDVQLFAPASSHAVSIQITANRPNSFGELRLIAPAGWQVSPLSQPFALAAVQDQANLTFTITASSTPDVASIGVDATVNGAHFNYQRIEIQYSHLPHILLQPPARLTAVSLDMAIRGHNVGYIPGAGDGLADAMRQMGYSVTKLNGTDLTPEKLHDLDAVVIGIRAFNVRTDLKDHLPALFDFIKAGGTVIAQYNRPEAKTTGIAPFDLRISQQRVTDPDAPMTYLAPHHPALNFPNKITQADFTGWVQERGTYFPDQWDKNFVPIVSCSDAGEAQLKGGLLIAHDGKGYFVYTGLTFFRQLPTGVPGAYRLFANLLSLGQQEPS
jgi:LmbE family N-acetylglucosaminyl deacetylase